MLLQINLAKMYICPHKIIIYDTEYQCITCSVVFHIGKHIKIDITVRQKSQNHV